MGSPCLWCKGAVYGVTTLVVYGSSVWGHHACGVREQCMGSPCLWCKGAVYGVTMLVV